MTFVNKSYAEQDQEKITDVCVPEHELKSYYYQCELANAELARYKDALETAYADPNSMSFYQEKPVALGMVVLVLILSTVLYAETH